MARLILLLTTTLALSSCGQIWLPESAERRIGELASGHMFERTPPVENSPWEAFVQDAGKKLAAASERPDYDYRFHIVASPEINAFALPDGQIFVTDSLLKAAGQDRDAVAAVLGHEIGHVARRHGAEALQSSIGLTAGGAAIFGFEGSLGRAAAGLASQLLELGYGRDMELEADLCSIRYLTRLGHPPEDGLRFLRLLAVREHEQAGSLDYYLRSHPPTDERIRYAESYAASVTATRELKPR